MDGNESSSISHFQLSLRLIARMPDTKFLIFMHCCNIRTFTSILQVVCQFTPVLEEFSPFFIAKLILMRF